MAIIPAPTAPTHDLGGTRFTSLATPSRGSVESSIWTVEIDPGVPPTPHSMTREEVFVVLDGTATVRVGSTTGEAVAGDAFVVPPETEFEVANRGSAPLRMMCCLPVGGQARTASTTFTPPWSE
jgi:quercetin dioxygenase-like cupin family protein